MPANHRVQAATPMPADPAGRPSQPVGKPDGQPAGSDAREPDRAQLPSARTMRDIRAAHPDSADKHALRERMDRLENRGAHVSRRALIAEVRREQTEPTNAQEVYSLPEPVADTRPLPVVHHADVDEHPLDSGSVDVVAMYASDAQDDLDPCCLFAETVLRPGGVLLLCCEVGAGVAVAIAYEVLQRAVRSIGKHTPRRRAGRRRSAASDAAAPDPVGGDPTAASEGIQSGQRPPHVGENRSPGGTVSVDGPTPAAGDEAAPHPAGGDTPPPSAGTEGGQGLPPVDGNRSPDGTISVDGLRSTTGDLPRATRSAYRQDAEAITDAGFERISASVRAAAAADSAAGHKLDRGLVRAAGAVEAGGRKRSAVDEAADDLPPCYVSPRIIEVARQVLGDRIDLDPASTAAQNRHARARVFYDGTDASWPGLKAAWPKDARVWVHVPRGANAVAFVERVLTHAAAGTPVVVLTENTTHLSWTDRGQGEPLDQHDRAGLPRRQPERLQHAELAMPVHHRHQHRVDDAERDDGEQERLDEVVAEVVDGHRRGQRRIRLAPPHHPRLAARDRVGQHALQPVGDACGGSAAVQQDPDVGDGPVSSRATRRRW